MLRDVLRCERLTKSFGGLCALNNVNLRFPKSGTVAIIGPNGAGKTTLINILTGFLRPDSGHCFFQEQETTYFSPHRISKMGIARTFQDLRLILQISVLDNVVLGRPHQRGESLVNAILGFYAENEVKNRKEALRLLQSVGLEGMCNELAGELSYGQQKLLTIACCLSTEAQVLILDEPVAGVHPEMAAHILNLLRDLQSNGKLIIFIEHDLAAVRQVADVVIVLDAGRVIAEGPPQDILEKPEIVELYLA